MKIGSVTLSISRNAIESNMASCSKVVGLTLKGAVFIGFQQLCFYGMQIIFDKVTSEIQFNGS